MSFISLETVKVIVLLFFAIIIFIAKKSKHKSYKNKKKEKDMSEQIPLPKKSIKLLSADGILLYEYNDVYIEYENTNIYMLSKQYRGKCFLRIEKGANMLLIVECYADTEKQDLKE